MQIVMLQSVLVWTRTSFLLYALRQVLRSLLHLVRLALLELAPEAVSTLYKMRILCDIAVCCLPARVLA